MNLVLTLTPLTINVNTVVRFTCRGIAVSKNVRSSGPKRMRELGRKSVTIWLDVLDVEAVHGAARAVGMTVAGFCRAASVLVANQGSTLENPETGRSARSYLTR